MSMRRSLLLLGLSLAWLGWMLWSAQANVLDATDPLTAIIGAAGALPVVISASMLAGTAAALTALAWRPAPGRWRWLQASGVGTVVGALAATLIIGGYGHRSSILLLAASVLVAGTVGGALGGIRPSEVVSAGVAGALAAFVADSVLGLFTSPLAHLFGAGDSAGSRLVAASRLALTTSLLAGVVAGLVAFTLLYRARCGWRFPVYLGAGATAGVLLLLTELITRVGGAQLFGLVGRLSEADQVYVDYVAQSRLNHGLIVLFLGSIVAILCLGSTMRRPEPVAPPVKSGRPPI
jgi:hypothetical protein